MKKQKKIFLREKTVIGKMLPIQPTKRNVILPGNIDKDDKYFYDQHPNQMEVVYVSNDFILSESNSENKIAVQPGDILYLDRGPSEREMMIIEKEVLSIALIGNVLCCIQKSKN